jgi:mRNA interferase RelE/StbE
VAYAVELTRTAHKALQDLDAVARTRIARAIDALAENPRPPGAVTLQGGAGALRIRVGDYRVIYTIEDARLVVLVLTIAHRREVYR